VVSQEAIAGAHHNPAVIKLGKRFEAVCSYETPANLPEFPKNVLALRADLEPDARDFVTEETRFKPCLGTGEE
jgi:hypothetical protein